MAKKKLIIIGGGFAGLNLVKKVDKKIWDVVIIDRNNYHSFRRCSTKWLRRVSNRRVYASLCAANSSVAVTMGPNTIWAR